MPKVKSEKRSKRVQGRNWIFTLNNPYENYGGLIDFDPFFEKLQYAIYSEEVGENGTHHFQGYLQFKVCVSRTYVMEIIPSCWCEPAKAPLQAEKYARKVDDPTFIDGPYVWGVQKATQGCLKEVGEMIKKGTSMYKIAQEFPAISIQYGKHLKEYQRTINPRFEVPQYKLEDFNMEPLDLSKPVLLWGNTNCGKTEFAISHFKKSLVVRHIDDLGLYNSEIHDGIVFDDMSFRHWPTINVIHLLDEDRGSSINIKYGTAHIPAKVKKIFTSNDPLLFYPEEITKLSDAHKNAIDRRINKINVKESLKK